MGAGIAQSVYRLRYMLLQFPGKKIGLFILKRVKTFSRICLAYLKGHRRLFTRKQTGTCVKFTTHTNVEL